MLSQSHPHVMWEDAEACALEILRAEALAMPVDVVTLEQATASAKRPMPTRDGRYYDVGANTAKLLRQLLFWYVRGYPNPYKTLEELAEETGLTVRKVRTAIENANKDGLLSSSTDPRPSDHRPTTYPRLNVVAFAMLFAPRCIELDRKRLKRPKPLERQQQLEERIGFMEGKLATLRELVDGLASEAESTAETPDETLNQTLDQDGNLTTYGVNLTDLRRVRQGSTKGRPTGRRPSSVEAENAKKPLSADEVTKRTIGRFRHKVGVNLSHEVCTPMAMVVDALRKDYGMTYSESRSMPEAMEDHYRAGGTVDAWTAFHTGLRRSPVEMPPWLVEKLGPACERADWVNAAKAGVRQDRPASTSTIGEATSAFARVLENPSEWAATFLTRVCEYESDDPHLSYVAQEIATDWYDEPAATSAIEKMLRKYVAEAPYEDEWGLAHDADDPGGYDDELDGLEDEPKADPRGFEGALAWEEQKKAKTSA